MKKGDIAMGMVTDLVRVPDSAVIITEEGSYPMEAAPFAGEGMRVSLEEKKGQLDVVLWAEEAEVRELVLIWKKMAEGADRVLADHWERGYGDLGWKEPKDGRVMPWYYLDDRGSCCEAYGVKVRPGAMCWWEMRKGDLLLHLDVRCGGLGVVLDGRSLDAASVLMKRYEGKTAFEAAQSFCRSMCQDSIYDGTPVYGSNNWYYAYGNSSREDILRDTAYLARLTKDIVPRPFMVIDDGWQSCHTEDYNGGPWKEGNERFRDMGQLAADMKTYLIRPGIWFRPLLDRSAKIPAAWRLQRDKSVLDISVPQVLDFIKKDVDRIAQWGYELVKHDFSTYDLLGRWGVQMGSELTEGGWRFWDKSRTTAEIIREFYAAIYEAAGDMLILGCNCIGHLGAGLMQLNRTGDDTSGIEWERTRKMGINTLAFRMPQQDAFFGADADCVGITDKIEWELNRQWMELLAISGTPFFVSVQPGLLEHAQEEQLQEAYRMAAKNRAVAVPMDWKKEQIPRKWMTMEGEKEFFWQKGEEVK